MSGIGLNNYRYLFTQDPFVRTAAWNTLWFVVIMVPAQILTGLGSAALLTKMRRGSAFYRTIFYLPALIPTVAGVLAFVYLLKPGKWAWSTTCSSLSASTTDRCGSTRRAGPSRR